MHRNRGFASSNLPLSRFSSNTVSHAKPHSSLHTKSITSLSHSVTSDVPSSSSPTLISTSTRQFAKRSQHSKPNSSKIRKLRNEHKESLSHGKSKGYYKTQESHRVYYEGKFTQYKTKDVQPLSFDDNDQGSDDMIITPREHIQRIQLRDKQLQEERALKKAAVTQSTKGNDSVIKTVNSHEDEKDVDSQSTKSQRTPGKKEAATGSASQSTTQPTNTHTKDPVPSLEDKITLSTFDKLRLSSTQYPVINPRSGPRKVRKRPVLPPSTFLELGINPAILGNLSHLGFTNPTAVQRLVIPYLIRRYNGKTGKIYIPPTVAIQEHTGSGKTLAYGLPIMSSINVKVDELIPPPNVIAAMHELRGVKVAYPPPLQADPTIMDERERPRVIQYGKDHIYHGNADDDGDNSLDVPDGSLDATPGLHKDVNSLEAARLQKKKLLMSRLQQIFPFLPSDKLDTDSPQSRLQSIIVVPTKELALQVTKSLNSINPTVRLSDTPQVGSHQIYGDHTTHIVPHQGKTTINVRMVTGKVNPVLLGSIGVFLHRDQDETLATDDKPSTKNPYASTTSIQTDGKQTTQDTSAVNKKTSTDHPFVEFSKGHGLYRENQDELRKDQIQKERQDVLRTMRLRERQLQGEVLSRLEQEEVEIFTAREKAGDFDHHKPYTEHDDVNSDEGDESDPDMIRMDVVNADIDHSSKQRMAARVTNKYLGELTPEQKEKQAKTVKDRFLQEVSTDLLQQIGGETGDHVEVVREKQPHVLVGTPETIVELIKSGAIQLPAVGPGPNQLKHIVFDEIDHLARNESSPEHYHVLQLLSLPADQCVFVSASMTRSTSQLMTRLARRQQLFVTNPSPHIETVSNLLSLPRPPLASLDDEQMELAYNEAFEHAQGKVQVFEKRLQSEDIKSVLSSSIKGADEGKLDKLLENQESKTQIINEITQKLYKKNFIPTIPDQIFRNNLETSLSKPLGVATSSDTYGEILFLTTEDYRPNTQQDNDGDPKSDAVPLPPYLRQFYLPFSYRTTGGKLNVLLDLICQLKVKPLQTRSHQRMKLTADAQQLLKKADSESSIALEVTTMRESLDSTMNDPNTTTTTTTQLKKGKPTRRDVLMSDSVTSADVSPGAVLVFFGAKEERDMLQVYKQLTDAQLRVGLYCSQSTRDQRREVLHHNDTLDVILANDTLSRGIDLKTVSTVINFDIPRSTTSFIHRCGRVGRLNGSFRRNSVVINMVEVPHQPKSKETISLDEILRDKASPLSTLSRHCEKVDLSINAWPYEQMHGLNFMLLRSIKTILAQEKEDEGIRAHKKRKQQEALDTKLRNIKLHKLGVVHVDNHKASPDSASRSSNSDMVGVQRLKQKVSQQIKGGNTNPWTYASSQKIASNGKTKVLRAK